ncbi:MAG: hypothetical protein IPP67_00295 [Rhodospirillaceae bacterium]|nr:hypothetical protein [Rhodospirillaceae bacterium]
MIHAIVQPADLDLEIEKIIESLLQRGALSATGDKKLVHEVSGPTNN